MYLLNRKDASFDSQGKFLGLLRTFGIFLALRRCGIRPHLVDEHRLKFRQNDPYFLKKILKKLMS